MINEIFIVDKKSENLFYHFRLPESKFQLTEIHAAQFAATIAKISEILSPDRTEKIQYLRTTSFKILFEVIDDFVFMLVADSEDDDLELNYLLATIVNRALPLLKENRIRFLNINDLMFKGRVKLSDKQVLPKLIILRFGDVHKALVKLKNEINALTSMRSYDTSSVMMISTMVEPIEKTLDDVKNALKELPYMP